MISPSHVSRDRLTIGRLLILTAGVGLGLALCLPRPFDVQNSEAWRALFTAALLGVSLTGPLFALADRRDTITWGGLFWFAQGLGVILMLPPMIAERFRQDSIRLSPFGCLAYVLPLMGLWFLLAAVASGLIRRRHWQSAAWRDRFGLFLSACWAPLGCWILFEFYADAFFR
jgi:hypothetical protein